MKVKEIMTEGIEMVRSSSMICEAAKKMKEFDINALPVQEKNNIVGVVTRRDIIVRGIAEDIDPKTTSVRQIMSFELACCNENESIEEAAKMMEERHVHRLLILDDQNNPVGILSLGDLAVKSHNEHLAWEVLERISEPARPRR